MFKTKKELERLEARLVSEAHYRTRLVGDLEERLKEMERRVARIEPAVSPAAARAVLSQEVRYHAHLDDEAVTKIFASRLGDRRR